METCLPTKSIKIVAGLWAFLLAMITGIPLHGQWKLAAGVGPAYYFGDLNQRLHPGQMGYIAGADLSWQFHPRWESELEVTFGTVRAHDRHSPFPEDRARNLHFVSPVQSVSISARFLLNGTGKKWNFIPGAGLGIVHYQPKARLGGRWFDLQFYGTEGQWLPGCDNCPIYDRQLHLFLSLSATYERCISPRVTLGARLQGMLPFTDYLDDVGGHYPNMAAIEAWNPLSPLLSYRGDPLLRPRDELTDQPRGDVKFPDWVGTMRLFLSIRLGKDE